MATALRSEEVEAPSARYPSTSALRAYAQGERRTANGERILRINTHQEVGNGPPIFLQPSQDC